MSHWNRADSWLAEFIKTNVRPMDFLENEGKTLAAAEEHPSESSSSVPYIFGITVDLSSQDLILI